LRTIAVERSALLGPIAKAHVDDHTSAQTFAHTQSLLEPHVSDRLEATGRSEAVAPDQALIEEAR
jgi:hypothetical protein